MSPEAANHKLFAALFQEHAGFVGRVLWRLGVEDPELEDAVQEVFLVVSHKLDTYEERGAVRAWLFSIARQVASHFRRSRLRLASKRQALLNQQQGVTPSPHDRVEAVALVNGFLARLDPDQAMVFYLCDVEGMTAPEVAVALELTLTTVHGRLRLARKRFEELVRRHERAER
jgi:RNA polymerase sigma-70 factor (ECF subfamily)